MYYRLSFIKFKVKFNRSSRRIITLLSYYYIIYIYFNKYLLELLY